MSEILQFTQKAVEFENLIGDSSFAYFTATNTDKRTIIFRDAYSEVLPNNDLEEDKTIIGFIGYL